MHPDPFPMDLATLRRLPRYQEALATVTRLDGGNA
jgi:hypothetical protein